jgi:hypothetical protein
VTTTIMEHYAILESYSQEKTSQLQCSKFQENSWGLQLSKPAFEAQAYAIFFYCSLFFGLSPMLHTCQIHCMAMFLWPIQSLLLLK